MSDGNDQQAVAGNVIDKGVWEMAQHQSAKVCVYKGPDLWMFCEQFDGMPDFCAKAFTKP